MRAGYLADSAFSRTGEALDLQTALGTTPTGMVDHPELFRGFLARPDVAAAGMLAVADVAASRYADAGLAKRLANLDPVVTASGDRLRFESFSACNGVHARFDLLADGIDSGEVGFGTTNVDINPPLRQALAGVGRSALLHVAVGSEELRLSTPDASYVEGKVDLPDRWVRGFAETPLIAASMTPVADLRGPAIAAFLGSLPRSAPPGPDLHLAEAGGRLQARLRPATDTVLLAGSARLRAAARIARFATRLRVHRSDTGASGWELDVPGGRLTLLLTAGPYRGFSGEGALLSFLSHPESELLGRRVGDALGWQPVIDPADLSRRLGVNAAGIDAGLAWLAASGRVGYDLAETAWFHRELPLDADSVLRRNPRLVSAQRLLDNGGVRDDDGGWSVDSSWARPYRVTREGDRYDCTCAWGSEHGGSRGPCKHVLAVLIATREQDGAAHADLGAPEV